MSLLVLLRHGQSQWNLENRFAGHTDVDLTAQGEEEAKTAGESLKDIKFDVVFTSTLRRAWRTAEIAMTSAGQPNVPVVRHDDLRERNYGDLTGMNKDAAREKFGREQVRRWRLEFDSPPPNGESLKDVLARVASRYKADIEPQIDAEKNILICAHEHSLRSILMAIGEHTAETISSVEFKNGVPVIFKNSGGRIKRLQP